MQTRDSIALGIVSGALLVLSLPKPDVYPLAWVALVPLLYAVFGSSHFRQSVAASYAAGVVFFGGVVYWIADTMSVYGGLALIPAVGIAALFSITFALYFAVFGIALHFLKERLGIRALWFTPALWVTIELLRAHLFTGFPWMLSGYALVPYSGILQIVAWTGIYGLSFIATAVNAVLAYSLLARSRAWLAGAVAAVALAWALPVIGERRADEPVAVRLVQTNISIGFPWKTDTKQELLDELAALSTESLPSLEIQAPQLVVWPETPSPFYLAEDTAFRGRMQSIARKSGAYLVLGYLGTSSNATSNSAAMLDPFGEIVSEYDKTHLVPFGEYVPLRRLFFFAESLTRQVSDFTPGTEYTVGMLEGRGISTAICYESIFPNLVRQFVKGGSELIVVITNDGWFGETSAPFQHLRMGVVRAVENRRYVVRAANTGISAIIDPYGRIEAQTAIGVRTVLNGVAHFRTERTFYTVYGDVFAYLNALSAVLGSVVAGFKQPRAENAFSRERRPISRRSLQ